MPAEAIAMSANRSEQTREGPLVSVVMPFLNAEKFIEESVESIFAQTYDNWELIFVDDGSSDSCASIVDRYIARDPARIRCVRHEGHQNRGISASRNEGVRHASGSYVAFCDADDLWLPHRLKTQIGILEAHPEAAMTYGLTQYWYGWTGDPEDLQRDFVPDLGIKTETVYDPPALLLALYPLGQATAPSMSNLLVRREFLQHVGGFEEEFRGLYEDQAFLVKAYLNGAIYVSGEWWDKYRIHPESCLSTGTEAGHYQTVRQRFLTWFESYLRGQAITDPVIWSALKKAVEIRSAPQETTHYGGFLFRVAESSEARIVAVPNKSAGLRVEIDRAAGAAYNIQLNQPRLKVQAGQHYAVNFEARADRSRTMAYGVAMAHEPWDGLGLYREVELTPEWKTFDEQFVATADDDNARIHFDLGGAAVAVELASVSLSLPDGSPATGGLQMGSLRRVTPISRQWGYDRGQPIDRYYIEGFLARQSGDIRGRALEIEDSTYTRRFGGNRVTRADILHVNDTNPLATIVADLTDAPQIPSNSFDCIVLTQTLQLIWDVQAAIRTVHRILRPGGVALVTFPGITQNNDRDWAYAWYWAFTPLSGKRLFAEVFGSENVKVEAVGNVLSASSFLYGISAGELTREELDHSERGYEVIITVRACKGESTS
jgi:glycosyltransferase involved in cell wall biosynthesis/SAM-dependent methyltransferase